MSEERPKVTDVICDAFTLVYGTDGAPSGTYWELGAAQALTMLIEAGWLPPEADPPLGQEDDGSDG